MHVAFLSTKYAMVNLCANSGSFVYYFWHICALIVLTRWEVVQPVQTKAILQPAKAAAMCMACLKYRPAIHLPLSHLASTKLCQTITCSQSQMMPFGIISG